MKTLYLECNMGAAGDMLMAALLELVPDKEAFIRQINALGIPHVKLEAVPSIKCGITGTHISVTVDGAEEESEDVGHHHDHHNEHDHSHSHNHEHEHNHQHSHDHNNQEHHHTGLHEIEHILSHLKLSEKVSQDVLAVYRLIAEAESHAHGKPVDQVHFHEVGMMDAVADIVGVCLLIEKIAPERILASPIHVGSGQVRCAHGILPIPAPATAHILRDVPVYGGAVRGELCTPTGAALLKHFVSEFGEMPVMKASKIGYGMGKKDFEAANCVRAFLSEDEENGDKIVELCCNLDDMTPETIGFAQERLFEGGALDVYTTAVGMKKCRPGVLLSCMCREEDRENMIQLIFKHTATLGVREYICKRYTLNRTERVESTPYGNVRIKKAEGWGITREKAEYEDIAKIAREHDLSFSDLDSILNENK